MSKETDVVLVYPNTRFSRAYWDEIRIPLSLLTIATPLDRAGYKVKIIDQRVEKYWKKILLDELKKEPICVGISSMTGPQIKYALEVSKLVKQNSNIPVVWEGVHPSLLPEQTLKNDVVDIVVQGEGEETFFELVQALKHNAPLNTIRGIWYKENGQLKENFPRPFVDLNKQPSLSYHLLPVEKYVVKRYGHRFFSFSTSRGCPRRCAFCYNTALNKGKWRALTVEEVLKRIRELIDKFHVEGIYFTDDNFLVDSVRVKEMLSGFIKEKINILFGRISVHAEDLVKMDDELWEYFIKNHFQTLLIGVESGSQRILDLIKKDLKISSVIELNKKLAKLPIKPIYSFMIGLPSESRADLSETVRLILRLLEENRRARITVKFYTPYPGTELFNLCLKYGLRPPQRLEDWISYDFYTINVPWLSKERKKLLYMLCFCSLCFSPFFLKKYVEMSNFKHLWAKLKYFLAFVLLKLYRPIAKRRMIKLSCRFPIEMKLAQFFGFFRPLSK